MRKILLWGIGADYESLLNQILFEIEKRNISVEGIICNSKDAYCKYKDGFRIITKDEISDYDYEYIVITSSKFLAEIEKEAYKSNVSRKKLIQGRVLNIPFFDFNKYFFLRENPVTILSDDCWGGYVYNRLNLPFTSPLINIAWHREEYARFIEDPVFYLKTDLKMEREGDLKKGIYPRASLGDKSRKVELELCHNTCFNEALEQWNRRMKRINFDNIFVKMGFSQSVSDSKKNIYLNAFDGVSYKKVLFYDGDEDIKGVFKTDRYIAEELKKKRIQIFDYNDYMRSEYYWDLDVFNLLLYGEKYSRYDYPFEV